MFVVSETTSPAPDAAPPVLGPEDAGRRMTLAEFGPALAAEGHLFELDRGIVVVDGPKYRHSKTIDHLYRRIDAHRHDHPGRIVLIADSLGCKLTIPEAGSERHPDLALYLDEPPADLDGDVLWAAWTPGIVVEVVSESSTRRDYVTKRQEYLALGIREYWIVDPGTRKVTALVRQGNEWAERVLTEADTLESPALPGLAILIGPVLGG